MAGTAQQLLLVNPGRTLVFKGPFDKAPRVAWQLYNPTNRRMAFKVQTTSPPHFFVQPRAGIVEATGRATIYIQLRPCTIESLQAFSPKFKLVNFFVPDNITSAEVDSFWETLTPDQCMKTTAMVRFDMSSSGSQINTPVPSSSGTIDNIPLPSVAGPSSTRNNNVVHRATVGAGIQAQAELATVGTGTGSGSVTGQCGSQIDEATGSQTDGTVESQCDEATTPPIGETVDVAIQGDDIPNDGNANKDGVDESSGVNANTDGVDESSGVSVEREVEIGPDGELRPYNEPHLWNLYGEFDCPFFWIYVAYVYGSCFLVFVLGYFFHHLWNRLF